MTAANAGAVNAAPATKTCPSCGTEKSTSEFYKDASKRGGLSSSCKSCVSERERQRRIANPKAGRRRLAKWRRENKEHHNRKNAEWRLANPEKAKEHQRRYVEKNPEAVKAAKKKWADANPEYMAEKGRKAARKRLETPKGRIEAAVRSVLGASLKGKKGGRRTFELLGYSVEDLMSHLESLFKPGMSWENYGRGGWEVDHRRPLASFSYEGTEDEQFKAAWALSNLQPLWMSENRKKSDKLLPEHI